jgi:two-component system phosphate regulon sensor histidine kinase PhoR
VRLQKSGYTLLIISISIVIVGIVQSYIIREQYQQKSDYFNLQYTQVINSALNAYRTNFFLNPFDSVYSEFDEFAFSVLPIINFDTEESLPDSTVNSVKSVFISILQHKDISPLIIKEALKQNNLDTSFIISYQINELSLLDFDLTLPVVNKKEGAPTEKEKEEVISKRIKHESNYFLVDFNQEIDFTRKRNILYKEMSGLIAVVILSLIVILLAFGYTLRTLNKQKKLSELKSDFIDNISHEFKTPLSSISLAASTLKHPIVGSNLMKRIDLSNNILAQNKILNEMIDQVIDASMLDGKKLSLKLTSVGVKAFFVKLIEEFKNEHKGQKLTIDFDFQLADSINFYIDQNQLYRAFRNVLNNSVKYCDKDPEIKITVKKYQDLIIEIQDNGIGISSDEKDLIFNRFYRSKQPAKNKSKGLGLGLYIVQKIIAGHNGFINLESESGKGTKVSILLPV